MDIKPTVKPAAKRSLFKKPAWADAQTSGDAVDFFSRSKQRYTDIVKEQDDRRRRKRNHLARRRGERDEAGEVEGEVGREGKRRKVTEEIISDDDDEEDGSSGDDDDDDDDNDDEEREAARRKAYAIALEDSDDDGRPPPPPPDVREVSPQPQPHSRRHVEATVNITNTTSHSHVHHVQKTAVSMAAAAAPIEISDNDDDSDQQSVQIQPSPRQRRLEEADRVIITSTHQQQSSHQEQEQDPDPVSDEEYPELARLAHERRARLQQQQQQQQQQQPTSTSHGGPGRPSALSPHSPHSPSAPVPSPSPFGPTSHIHLLSPPPTTAAAAAASRPAPIDSKLSILITSRIGATNPLIVQRKLSQPLKDVRLAWCKRQPTFDQDTTDSVFLTWRGKRLFDVTTCKSLGIGVDVDGNIVTKGEKADALGDENKQIHMEAMTQEIFDEVRKARQKNPAGGGGGGGVGFGHGHGHEMQVQSQVNAGLGEHAATDAVAGTAEEEESQKEQQIRVILKSKGFEDFKLIIKPTTKISRMVNAFRQARKVGPDRAVFLMFDGDRLRPADTVSHTEISDLDHIDVHVK
ncbi:MAG: hypothetical protein M1816_007428 [Peltula sp. TS41687]|nr:MAG: hypothetical protein M1816_007428 [Peltula sp. TS41687]